MNIIKLLGPPSEKYERLKKRIIRLIELCEEEVELHEIKDINQIVKEDVQVVPTALYEGKSRYIWTIATSLDDMLKQLGVNKKPIPSLRQMKGGRKKRELDPLHELDD